MKLSSTSLPLLSLAVYSTTATELSAENEEGPQYIFSNPPASSSSSLKHRIPTSYESAVMGRRILALTPLGNLATVFPSDDNAEFGTMENRPPGLGGMPHALMEYVADCEGTGDPTFLAINIETSFKNVRDGSNISLAQQWTPTYPPAKRIQSEESSSLLSRFVNWWYPVGCTKTVTSRKPNDDDDEDPDTPDVTTSYSAANLPRFSLLGYIEKITPSSASYSSLSSCFVKKHPDAKYWLPGNRIHESEFVRLKVQQVYWVGGFGDRAYIGWIPVDEWRNVTAQEWQDVRLPGEKKGWKEWSVEDDAGSRVGDL